ncbi:DUF6412 domain-containing protein [Actinocorallia longicatena]|uniref:Uncharacterized protein n=1 Tax=Actinocorallia longicatena TaxID=111803 RepID=A0ABP6QBI7_9ACTN
MIAIVAWVRPGPTAPSAALLSLTLAALLVAGLAAVIVARLGLAEPLTAIVRLRTRASLAVFVPVSHPGAPGRARPRAPTALIGSLIRSFPSFTGGSPCPCSPRPSRAPTTCSAR